MKKFRITFLGILGVTVHPQIIKADGWDNNGSSLDFYTKKGETSQIVLSVKTSQDYIVELVNDDDEAFFAKMKEIRVLLSSLAQEVEKQQEILRKQHNALAGIE